MTEWKYDKPYTHEYAGNYYRCRKLEPTETVKASDGYDLGFYGGPSRDELICVPGNWINELAGNCEHPIYRKIQ